MQVILQKSVSHLGLVGDVVNVAAGYYRNFLGPRNLALLANPKSIHQVEHQKKVIEAKKAKERTVAEAIKAKIEASPVTIAHAAGTGDKLFGSVTSQEVVMALKAAGFAVDKKLLKLETPIKNLGEHLVEVKLHPDVVAQVKINVLKK
ncbi:MAG: 50S ribosomal protein L9 [Deltaproteobacteria bacterium]|nr:50S ribosomal protein L9 [Deltaproteobacteria bacterium]